MTMMSDDWAIKVTDDTIELAPGTTVHRNNPRPFISGYVVVRNGVVVSLIDGCSYNLARLLDSAATDDPVPPLAWEAWRAHPSPIVV